MSHRAPFVVAPVLIVFALLGGACSDNSDPYPLYAQPEHSNPVVGPPGGSVDGVANGSPAGSSSSSASSSSSTTTGSGTTTQTQVVCRPGCSDEPRDSESCDDAKNWGFCDQDWFGDFCQKTCGTCDDDDEICETIEVEVPSTGGGTQRPVGDGDVTPVPAGSPQGWASRYWDCCMQHCSWREHAPSGAAVTCNRQNQVSSADGGSACSGGSNYTCWSMAPWAVTEHLAYGYAAVPPGGSCGKCYQLDFTGRGEHNASDAGSQTLSGKSMIVQATNIGYDVNGGQFDILIPGGGVGAFNACTDQWGVSDLGASHGGFLTACNDSVSCLRNKCEQVFAGKPDLLAGCLFHVEWMGGANNPQFNYAEVPCPSALEQTSGMAD